MNLTTTRFASRSQEMLSWLWFAPLHLVATPSFVFTFLKLRFTFLFYLLLFYKDRPLNSVYLLLFYKDHLLNLGYLLLFYKDHLLNSVYLLLFYKDHLLNSVYLLLFYKDHLLTSVYLLLFYKDHLLNSVYLLLFYKGHLLNSVLYLFISSVMSSTTNGFQSNHPCFSSTKGCVTSSCCAIGVKRLAHVVHSQRNSSHIYGGDKELNNSCQWNKHCTHPSKGGGKLHMPGDKQIWHWRENVHSCGLWVTQIISFN